MGNTSPCCTAVRSQDKSMEAMLSNSNNLAPSPVHLAKPCLTISSHSRTQYSSNRKGSTMKKIYDTKDTTACSFITTPPKLAKQFSATSCISLRDTSRFSSYENFRVVSISAQLIEQCKIPKWISTLPLSENIIYQGELSRYMQISSKSIMVARYCKVNAKALSYYHNEAQSTEWLAKPLNILKVSEMEQVNRIVLDGKNNNKSKDGFEILMRWPQGKEYFDVNHSIFICEDKCECIRWIMLLKHLMGQARNDVIPPQCM